MFSAIIIIIIINHITNSSIYMLLFVISLHVDNSHGRSDLEGSSPLRIKLFPEQKTAACLYTEAYKIVSVFLTLPLSVK